MAGIGHNSDVLNQTAQSQLKALVDRIENLAVEKAEIQSQITEVYAEAKGAGFDTAVLRKLIAARKRDVSKVRAEREILELYASALGVLDLV